MAHDTLDGPLHKPLTMTHTDTASIEPLRDLAQWAWGNAPHRCQPEHGCVDYHRTWSLVRLLIGGGRLPAGEPFFQRELQQRFQRGQRRILISGGADSGLLTIVLNACKIHHIEPDLVFADRCATACELNAQMAHHAQVHIKIIQGDITALDIPPVDVVVAHSFLPFFDGVARQQVLDTWFRLCRNEGQLLMSNVLKSDEQEWQTNTSPDAIPQLKLDLIQRAQAAGHAHDLVMQMAESAQRFWSSSPAQPPGLTADNLTAGLHSAGFQHVAIQYTDAGLNDGPIALAKHTRKGKLRAEITAVKSAGQTHCEVTPD